MIKECTELDKKLRENKTLMVTKQGCPFCQGARELLNEHKVKFLDVDHTSNEQLDKEITDKYDYTTYPKVFVEGKFVGGLSQLKDYVKTKEFESVSRL